MKPWPVTLPQVSNAEDIVFHLIFTFLPSWRDRSFGIHILLSSSTDSIIQDLNLSVFKEGNCMLMILGSFCFFSPNSYKKTKYSAFHSWMKGQTRSRLCCFHVPLSQVNKFLRNQTILSLIIDKVSCETSLRLTYLKGNIKNKL